MALPVGLGGGDAFAHLYAAHAPRVAGLARRLVPDAAAVDDVVQETMLRAYRAGLHLEDGTDPWPWLATVARNLCHDLHRRHPERQVALEESNVVALAPGPERAVEDRARAAYVARALQGLPSRQRHLLLLRHVDGVPCAQIAHREETSVEAVKSALARARDAFRDRYEGWRGLVPGALGQMASRVRAQVTGLRPGTAGAVAAVLALGLAAPPGTAAEPDAVAPPPAVSGPDLAPDPTERPDRPIDGGAPEAPPMPAGGRLISFQPPESPDVPPTPALVPPSPAPPAAVAPAPPPPGGDVDVPLPAVEPPVLDGTGTELLLQVLTATVEAVTAELTLP